MLPLFHILQHRRQQLLNGNAFRGRHHRPSHRTRRWYNDRSDYDYDDYDRTSRRADRDEKYSNYSSRKTRRSAPSSISSAAQRIIDCVEDYLDQVPAGGASLASVVDHVVLETDYESSIVRSVITRHFVNNGTVVRNQRDVETSSLAPIEDPIIDSMRDVLNDLGYTDLRDDVDLTGFADLDETADLIAYNGDDPLVLCFPVDEGDVDDPAVQEAAKFQAGAVAPGKKARFVWISDGVSDFFYDLQRDSVIATLPGNAEVVPPPAKPSAPAKSPDPNPKP